MWRETQAACLKLEYDLIEMLGSTRFKKKREQEEEERMEEPDFPHDEECPTVFGISNIVSHIRMESEVAWDGPSGRRCLTDDDPMSVSPIEVVSYLATLKPPRNVKLPLAFLTSSSTLPAFAAH